MVKLPEVPTLDVSSPGAPSPEASEPGGTPLPLAVPVAAAADGPLPGGLEEALFGDEAPTADAAEPVPATSSEQEPRPKGATGDAPATSDALPGRAPTDDSVEEMLSQTSEMMLRLVRVEEAVSEMSATLNDTREEMHAGLAELRGALAQLESVLSQRNGDAGLDVSLAPRLDALDAQTTHSASRLSGRLSLVIILQLLVAAGVAVAIWLSGGNTPSLPGAEPSRGVASEVSGMPQPGGVEEGELLDDSAARKAKRRRKRRGP